MCPAGVAEGQPGLLLRPSLGTSALVWLGWLVVNAGAGWHRHCLMETSCVAFPGPAAIQPELPTAPVCIT